MRLIVVTSSEYIDKEAEKINALFKAGMEILHIRKPNSSKKEYINLIKGIEKKYYPQIKIHEFFELTDSCDFLGIHLNKRNPVYLGNKNINISKSCHSIEELNTIEEYDYVFLSPIFDSISKQGYCSNFSDEDLAKASMEKKINKKVIALGGINQATLSVVKKYAFGGVAVLGCIWETENVVSTFSALFISCKNHH
jgi:thiamine-phosphate pyrophosphorylase